MCAANLRDGGGDLPRIPAMTVWAYALDQSFTPALQMGKSGFYQCSVQGRIWPITRRKPAANNMLAPAVSYNRFAEAERLP